MALVRPAGALFFNVNFSPGEVFAGFLWPFGENLNLASLSRPYLYFGLVGVVYFLLLGACRWLSAKSLSVHALMGSLSGTLGSLYWWIAWGPWYFSVLHGTIWGSLVGFGVWRSQRWLRLGSDSTDR